MRTIDAFGDPAQIGFSPDGRSLVITQRRGTLAMGSGAEPDNIEIVSLSENGIPIRIHQRDVEANQPFAFRFDEQNRMYLAYAFSQIQARSLPIRCIPVAL